MLGILNISFKGLGSIRDTIEYRHRELTNAYFGFRESQLGLLVYARRRLRNLSCFHVERPLVLMS